MMKFKFLLLGSLALALVIVSMAAMSRSKNDADYLNKRVELVVRDIGHKLLLHAGDSSSRVLPVKQRGHGVFQLEFQSAFSFMPDSLVSIVRNDMKRSGISDHYMLNVVECASKEVVYGFEIAPLQNNIISCNGRKQPLRCYILEFTFTALHEAPEQNSSVYLYLIATVGLSIVAFIGGSYFKKEKTPVVSISGTHIPLGKYAFYTEQRILKSNDASITLSDKESRVLGILAAACNQLVSRDQLLKEVWEDEGVFTGRSLDMFISKLRKKLKDDPDVQIINVHGKGYKLEIRPA